MFSSLRGRLNSRSHRGPRGVLAAVLVGTTVMGAASAYAASPSGTAVGSSRLQPKLSTSPFSLVSQDDFNGTSLNPAAWTIFHGPGNGQTGPKATQNVIVNNGILTLRATQINGVWYGASVAAIPVSVQTYGKYVIRARFDAGAGIRCVALLWPTVGWPPEVDFMEIPSMYPLRQHSDLTNHYWSGTTRMMEHARVDADFTQWHDVGLEWTPTALNYTLDGVVVKVMTTNVPNQNMWLGLTTALGTGKYAPSSATPKIVDFNVDSVQIYKYVG